MRLWSPLTAHFLLHEVTGCEFTTSMSSEMSALPFSKPLLPSAEPSCVAATC
jgi:hypothetical protein